MSAALAVVAALALVAGLTLLLVGRKARARLAEERLRAEGVEDQLRSSVEARSDAEHRAEQAQLALAAAGERADRSDRRAADVAGRLAVVGALWELERVRLEREWAEVTGSTAPMPEPWDGGSRAALAVELEIIREVIGVPSRLEPAGAAHPEDPLAAMGTFRLAAEALRALARVGEEIGVSFEADGDVTMTIATDGGVAQPHLERVTASAAAMGGELEVLPTAEGFRARLHLPALQGLELG
jgi:hypothetical protein